MAFLIRHVIWNPALVSEHTPLESDTLIGLVDAEHRTNSSISSVVKTRDIKQIIEAVYNETNVKLCHAPYRAYRKAGK